MKTEYTIFGLSLSDAQKKSLARAIQGKTNLTLRLNLRQLSGNDKLALTKNQIAHITKNKNMQRGSDINLSKTQLQKMKKMGGFLPLIPLILAGISAAGALAGGAASIAKTVHEKQASDATITEQARHNREIESQLRGSGLMTYCPTCRGSGLYLSKNR